MGTEMNGRKFSSPYDNYPIGTRVRRRNGQAFSNSNMTALVVAPDVDSPFKREGVIWMDTGSFAYPSIIEKDEEEASALDTQEGGDHYKSMSIQPIEYSFHNKLDPCQHTIIKYVSRFREKGRQEDLEKAKHCIDLLIELEYGDKDGPE